MRLVALILIVLAGLGYWRRRVRLADPWNRPTLIAQKKAVMAAPVIRARPP